MLKNFRKTLRFQIGAIVSLVLAILLMAFISMHMVSVSYDREVLTDKQEKLKVISQGLARSLGSLIQKDRQPAEITGYFRNQTENIIDATPRMVVALDIPEMDINIVFPEASREANILRFKHQNRDGDQFFDARVSTIKGPRSFVQDGPAGIFLGRAEPILVGHKVRGVILIAERVQPGLSVFRLITRIVFFLVLISLIVGIIATVWVLARLKRGVRHITAGLARLEKDTGYRLTPPPSGELGEISSAINDMADAVEHKSLLEEQLEKSSRLAALGQLVAGVAHEIRNPLGIMKATVQVMKDEFAGQEQIQEYLLVLNEQVERQNKVIKELLDYAKPVPAIFQPMDLNEIIKSVLGFSKSYFQQQKVAVITELSEDTDYVNVDVEKLKQIFLNLIFNAVEAMPEGGQLSIKTLTGAHSVIVEFADTGRGIAEGDMEKLFDPFFTTKNSGTGLGLAMVHKIIEIHQGRIEIESKLNEGTLVRIILPADDIER